MPKIGTEDSEMQTHQTAGNFSFSGVRLERLGATEYTLASLLVDTTGSVHLFADSLRDAVETAVSSLQKSPRAANLLVRVAEFNSGVGVREIHGFKPLSSIDVDKDYKPFHPEGWTNLFDATYSSVIATADYGKQLRDNDYSVNAIVILVTDGGDNASTMGPQSIQQLIEKIRTDEDLESILTILVGVNAAAYDTYLQKFKLESGLDEYLDIGDATPEKLAKLAGFISQSVSSQSKALGTGGPSQNIAATI